MFDTFKAMGVLANLAKNKEELLAVVERVKAEADELRVAGEAGSGAVRAIADGRMRIISVELSPGIAAAPDSEQGVEAEMLVAGAVNEALRNAQIAMRDIVNREAEAFGLPRLPDDMGGLLEQ